MAFELPDGKIARNIQEQVAFLTEKLKDLYAAFNQSGLKKIVIVEELPEVGDPNVLYLLAMEDPEENNYYDDYRINDSASAHRQRADHSTDKRKRNSARQHRHKGYGERIRAENYMTSCK